MLRLIALGLLAGFTLPAAAGAQSRDGGSLETLLGVRVGPSGIAFAVVTTGCTDKEDFRVETLGPAHLQVPGDDPVRIALIREVFDPCQAIPDRTVIHFSFREIGLAPPTPIVLINTIEPRPLEPSPEPGR